jgi:hypothetical protein
VPCAEDGLRSATPRRASSTSRRRIHVVFQQSCIYPSGLLFNATAFLQPGERPEEFATRVQRMVAARAGLKAVDWDGYMKYWKPSRCETGLLRAGCLVTGGRAGAGAC